MVRERFMFNTPSSRQIAATVKALGTDEGRLRHTEARAEEWAARHSHLPKNYSRKVVRSYLQGTKCNLESFKRKFEAYFLAKAAHPEILTNRDPFSEEIAQACENVHIVFLPKFTEDCERISVMSLASPDSADFNIVGVLKLLFMICDLVMTFEHPVNHEIIIFDAKDLTPAHFVQFLTATFRHGLTIAKDAYPFRVHRIHVVNAPHLFERILSTIRPVLHEKVRTRFVIHKTQESLLEHVDPELLPRDLGGRLEGLRWHMERWREILRDNREWFREQEAVGIRGTPPKRFNQFAEDMMEGSFRQLTVD